MYYDIIYKIRNKSIESILEGISYEEVKEIIRQLGEGVTSLNGELVLSLLELEKLQIFEKDYQFKSGGNHYIATSPDTGFNHIAMEDISQDAGEQYIPHYKDITNKVFKECALKSSKTISGDSIVYKNDILTVCGKDYPLKSDSKINELFELIIRTKNYLGKSEITYEKLLEVYNNSEYTNLRSQDIQYIPMRNLLKYKLKVIKNDFKLDTDILVLNTQKIIFPEIG